MQWVGISLLIGIILEEHQFQLGVLPVSIMVGVKKLIWQDMPRYPMT